MLSVNEVLLVFHCFEMYIWTIQYSIAYAVISIELRPRSHIRQQTIAAILTPTAAVTLVQQHKTADSDTNFNDMLNMLRLLRTRAASTMQKKLFWHLPIN